MTKKNVIPQDPIGDGVGARKLKVRFSLSRWASTKHHMEGLSRHNSSLTGSKNPAKFENDRISRNGHRIKIIKPNLMI